MAQIVFSNVCKFFSINFLTIKDKPISLARTLKGQSIEDSNKKEDHKRSIN